jgi:hypothetical protein
MGCLGLEGAMMQSRAHKHDRRPYREAILPAWLSVAKRPEGSMLLYHLSQQHPDEVGPYLERMRTECIATVTAEAFEVIEEGETR